MKHHRRFVVFGLAVVGIGLLAAFLWPAPPSPALVHQTKVAARETLSEPSHTVVSAQDMARTHQMVQDPAAVATYLEHYKEANRYSPATVRLLPGMTDVLEPDLMPARDLPVLGVRNLYTKPEYRLYYRFETDKFRYVAPEPIRLHLSVFRGEHRREPVAAVKVGRVEIYRLRPSGESARLGSVQMEEQSPGEYTATWQPPQRNGAREDDVYRFEVGWDFPGGKLNPMREQALVQYTLAPPVSFTGRFLERVEEGSLFIEAEVEGERQGEALVTANLFASDGTTPVAFSSVSMRLVPGRSWVRLEFYGLVFHDQQLAGPYILKTLRGHLRSTTSSGRGAEFAHFTDSYTTRSYALSDFTSKEWDSPTKRAGLKAYEEELAQLTMRGGN